METARSAASARLAPRQVSLLPRHWAWLSTQPRSTSATLRRLVDEARKDRDGRFEIDATRERCYFLMRDLAGDGPGFEEASRALYAGDSARFAEILAGWPEGVRRQIEAVALGVRSVPDKRPECV